MDMRKAGTGLHLADLVAKHVCGSSRPVADLGFPAALHPEAEETASRGEAG